MERYLLVLLALFTGAAAYAKAAPKLPKDVAPVDSALELYQAVNSISKNSCLDKTCTATMEKVDCRWPNAAKAKTADCHYQDSQGRIQNVTGAPALRLARALSAQNNLKNQCGAGYCWFALAQNTSCGEVRGTGRTLSYDCHTTADTCLSKEKAGNLAALQSKFDRAQKVRPDCVDGRGASACLSPREMLMYGKLVQEQASQCGSPTVKPAPALAPPSSPQDEGDTSPAL